MKKILQSFLLIISQILVQSCKTDANNDDLKQYKIVVDFEYGVDLAPIAYKNIYVLWIEDSSSNFIQNIFICKKLTSGGLTGIALPYWKVNKYPYSDMGEIDAVTSATNANTDFSVSTFLKDNSKRKFVLYFEIDRSYEPNDWFPDQPSLLYSAVIDLEGNSSSYELQPIGWTPNEDQQNLIPDTPLGKLQSEMRYITNLKIGSSFGDTDSRSATKMVKKITVRLESP